MNVLQYVYCIQDVRSQNVQCVKISAHTDRYLIHNYHQYIFNRKIMNCPTRRINTSFLEFLHVVKKVWHENYI